MRFGFVQRSSVYWPTNHEARKDAVGIAVIKGHTAYQIPTSRLKPDSFPPNRPGLPPEIITWADAAYLKEFKEDIAALRPQVDVLVASCHWGVGHDVLQYMTEIAHGAIDAGADIVVGHGPHYVLPIEVYKGKPIFYSLCNLSFHSGHRGVHGDWTGLLVRVTLEGGQGRRAGRSASCATTTRTRRSSHRSAMKPRRWPKSSPAAPRFGTQAQAATASTSRSRSSAFHGLGTPSNIPAEIIETLNKERDLFGHRVGTTEQHRRYRQSNRLGGLQVHDNFKLVTIWMGMSPALVPFKILSAYSAIRRNSRGYLRHNSHSPLDIFAETIDRGNLLPP